MGPLYINAYQVEPTFTAIVTTTIFWILSISPSLVYTASSLIFTVLYAASGKVKDFSWSHDYYVMPPLTFLSESWKAVKSRIRP